MSPIRFIVQSNPGDAEQRFSALARGGNEWHNLCYYTLVNGVSEPRDPVLRSTVVRW